MSDNKITSFFKETKNMSFEDRVNLLNRYKFTYREVESVTSLFKIHFNYDMKKLLRELKWYCVFDEGDKADLSETVLHVSHIRNNKIHDIGFNSVTYSDECSMDCVDISDWSYTQFQNDYKLGCIGEKIISDTIH